MKDNQMLITDDVKYGATATFGGCGDGGYVHRRTPLVFFSRFSGFFICYILFFFFSLLSLNGFCQPGAELGVIGGGGYYLGDYNPSRHFESTQPYFGGFYRYNLNDRFALRLNAGFSKIEMPDARLSDNAERKFPLGISKPITDVCGLIEFNFRSFMVRKIQESSLWAPYVFTGAGFLSAGDNGGLVIPLGIGVKFNLYRQISCGIEWSARKTFTDYLDGVSDPWNTGETNQIYNKDWFFVMGLTISYRFPMEPECYQ